MKVVLAAAACLGIALVLWLALREPSSAAAPVERPVPKPAEDADSRGASQSVALEAGETTAPAPTAEPAKTSRAPVVAAEVGAPKSTDPAPAQRLGPRVRSSSGLTIASVSIDEGPEKPLVEGRLDLQSASLPVTIRARGHRAARVDRIDGEVVLEPFALLIVEGHDLARTLLSIGAVNFANDPDSGGHADTAVLHSSEERMDKFLENDDALRQSSDALSGLLDANRWAIAATRPKTISGISLVGNEPSIPFEVQWRDRRHAYARFVPRDGEFHRWTLPESNATEVAPLNVTMVPDSGAKARKLVLSLTSGYDPQWRRTTQPEPWGNVILEPVGQVRLQGLMASDKNGLFRLGVVPLGRPYELSLDDAVWGSFANASFTHDGSARAIALRDAPILRGRVSIPGTNERGCVASFTWTDPTSGIESQLYSSAIGTDGRIDIRNWRPKPESFAKLGPLPSTIQIEIRVDGYEPLRTLVSCEGGRVYRADGLALVPVRNPADQPR